MKPKLLYLSSFSRGFPRVFPVCGLFHKITELTLTGHHAQPVYMALRGEASPDDIVRDVTDDAGSPGKGAVAANLEVTCGRGLTAKSRIVTYRDRS